ncbi:energy transducer TonB [Dyella mobilis]|uniref:Energy transducer TonB n=1 Tax=Dyella mobilis TaxID=1849582 RepID=A0ABS2KBT4_9GAMM|nr:energy transducer TonB [Dyella mobilis]MBM7128641.1 energy transducer TonB [Dyella mobilis]
MRKLAEASMLVTGSIDVMPDGSVRNYTIDRPEKISPTVLSLIQKSVPNWKFEAENGTTAVERAKMNLRLVARRTDDTHGSIAITGATFFDANAPTTDSVHSGSKRSLPRYPPEAIAARVSGTVFLIMQVGRQGQVEQVAAEQVNLGVYGSESQMHRFRDMLADASINAAKTWTFNVPTTGKQASDAHWNVRVPVAFNLTADNASNDTYGKWQAYIPGPREYIPWVQKDQLASQGSDAIPDGTLAPADQPLHLTTALDGT